MAGLPPKPLDSPSTQRGERHNPTESKDSHPVRPMAPPSRYRERPLSMSDRVYVPRTRSSVAGYDSYVAPAYDKRREDDVRRRDYVNRERDRGRGVWERVGEIQDRDRESRFSEPGLEHDRDRRGYPRERGHDRDRGYYSPRDRHRDSYDRRDHRPSSPIRPGISEVSYRRSSRSPTRRRAISPAPSYRTKTTPRPRSRSPPAKRMKLEHQSDFASPQPRSPLRNTHEPPSPQVPESAAKQPHVEHSHPSTFLSPPQALHETCENSPPSTLTAGPEDSGPPPSLSQSERSTEISSTQKHPLSSRPESLKQEHADNTSVVVPESFDTQEVTHRTNIRIEAKRDEKESKDKRDVKIVDRTLSPPKHPRVRDAQQHGIMHHRRDSRSPPRGPRNHSKNMTVPAAPSFPPTALPRGPRRQYPPSTSLVSQDSISPVSLDEPPAPGLTVGPDTKVTLPVIPAYKPRPNLTPELDIEIARLQARRAHLASEYVQISKGTRRALHELDTATLDLRAAESRRKVADSQMEKARAGVLGVDAGPMYGSM